jgi:hypothetical protein
MQKILIALIIFFLMGCYQEKEIDPTEEAENTGAYTTVQTDADTNGAIDINKGGTNAQTFTDGGILLGSGTSAITALGVATNGQIPIGDGTTDPVLATITGTTDEIAVANGSGSITLSLDDDFEPLVTEGSLTDDVIIEEDLKITNAAVNGYILSSDTATSGFTWVANSAVTEGTAVLSTGEVGAVKYLREDGDGTCSWQTPAGSGDVSKVGTPVDNQVGVWTGNGTLEGTTGLTYDGSDLAATGNVSSTGSFIIGSADVNETELEVLDGATLSTTELNYVDNVTSAIQTQLNAKEGSLTNSAGLRAALSDETGTGVSVFGTTPSINTSILTTPSAASIPVTVKGAAAQTAHLLNATDSADASLAYIQANGRIWTGAGVRSDALAFGGSLMLLDSGGLVIDHDVTGEHGNYDLTGGVAESLFTDSTNSPFTQDDADTNNWIIIRSGTYTGAMAEIIRYIDADNVELHTMGWTGDISNVDFYIIEHPMNVIGDGHHMEYQLSTAGHFDIHSTAWVGNNYSTYLAEVELEAGVDGVNGLLARVEANGYNNVTPLEIDYESGDLSPGEVGGGIGIRVDISGATSADSTTIATGITASLVNGSDATTRAMSVEPGWDEAFHVSGATSADQAFGYEVSGGGVTETDRVNSGGAGDDAFINAAVDVAIFDADDDYILIGSASTFEVFEANLVSGSTKNIVPSFFYSKAGGNWTALSVLSDETSGFLQSGQITFNAPGDWTKDDESMDATAITDAYYIAIQRTYAAAMTAPVEDYFKIYSSLGAGMKIKGTGIITASYTTAAPSVPENGDLWMESDGVHAYYNGGENTLAIPGAFDSTAVDDTTWSDNANAANTWTFDVSGTDHTMIAGDGLMTFSGAVTAVGAITGSSIVSAAYDATGAVGMDYGSADITDHSFVSDGGTAIIDGSYQFPDADGTPSAVGELQYDNTVTGLLDGAMVWYDDDAARYLVDLDTLPSDDDYVVAYDAPGDRFYMKIDADSGGTTSWTDITAATANSEHDLGTYANELKLAATGTVQIGDGGANYVKFTNDGGTVKMSLEGNAEMSIGVQTVSDTAVFAQTGTSDADYFSIAAYDVNGTTYESLFRPVASNTPHLELGPGTNFVKVSQVGLMTFEGTASITLPDDNVTAAQVADGDHGAFTYTTNVAALDANSVDSDQYVDGSIDNVHLAVNSVDSDNYVDASIDNAHLADNAVDSDEIASGAVDYDHLSAGAKFYSIAVAGLGDTTTPSVLTTEETTNKCISNYKASGADHVFTMPAAHAGGNIIFSIGDEFQVDIEPNTSDLFYLNGTAMAADEHIQNTADTLGERIVGYCVNINGTLRWMFYSSDTAWVEETP